MINLYFSKAEEYEKKKKKKREADQSRSRRRRRRFFLRPPTIFSLSFSFTHSPTKKTPKHTRTPEHPNKHQYEEGSAPALALQATIDRTDKRFANYAKAGLLCGTDGLPHLISDPGLALRYGHAGETLIPTIGFLYVAGWIGSVGREYIQTVAKDAKPTEKEIIIDVPLALSLAAKGAGWPAKALTELRNGTLLEKDENITISPR